LNDNSEYIKTNDYISENIDIILLNSDYITIRKNQRKKIAKEKTEYIHTSYTKENIIDFDRQITQQKKHVIVSQLSNSAKNKIHISKSVLKNYGNQYYDRYKTNSPKKKQITMTFSRPEKPESSKFCQKQTTKKRSTFQIIKQYNHLPHLQYYKMLTTNSMNSSTISYKKLVSERSIKCFMPQAVSNISKVKSDAEKHTLNINEWVDESIISKSPNLVMNTYLHEKKKKHLKSPIFEKKPGTIQPRYTNTSTAITSTKISSTTINKSYTTMKYDTLTRNSKETKHCTKISKNKIPTKHQLDCSIKSVITNKPKITSCHNQIFNASRVLGTSIAKGNKILQKKKSKNKNLKIGTKNLDNYIYFNIKKNLIEDNNFNILNFVKGTKADNIYFSTFKKQFATFLSEPQLVSGVEILNSSNSSKSNSKFNKLYKQTVSKKDAILNQSVFNSILHVKPQIDKQPTAEINSFKNSGMPEKSSDSVQCIKGFSVSKSNDSCLSIVTFDNHNTNSYTESKNNVNSNSLLSLDNLITCRDEYLSYLNKFDLESSLNIEEKYKFEDPEENVALQERRLSFSPAR
jgi:hypothetical protein